MKDSNSGKGPRRRLPQIAVRLPPDQIEALNRAAEKSGGRQNRSDLIREAIDEYLKRRKSQ